MKDVLNWIQLAMQKSGLVETQRFFVSWPHSFFYLRTLSKNTIAWYLIKNRTLPSLRAHLNKIGIENEDPYDKECE